MFSFFVVEMEDCQHCFCSTELQFLRLEAFTYSCHSLFSTHFTVCQSPSAYVIARSLAYDYVLETVLASQRCRCWREAVSRQVLVGRCSWCIVTYSVCR